MKDIFLNKVTKHHIQTLSLFTKPKLFQTEFSIIHEGHIPQAGYLLIKGEIHFLKKKNIIQRIQAGTLFGVAELMSNSPLKFSVRILPRSTVFILDKSTIKEVIKDIDKKKLPLSMQIKVS